MATQKTLVIYGSRALQNNRFKISAEDARRFSSAELQRLSLSRAYGSVPVSTKITEKTISMVGKVGNPAYNLQAVLEEFGSILNKKDQYLRFVPEYTIIDDTSDAGSWTNLSSSLTGNLRTDALSSQLGSSIVWDYIVANHGTHSMEKTLSSAINITNFAGGNINFFLYLSNIYSNNPFVTFYIGNDSSNYLSYTTAYDYQGLKLNYGWNMVSIPLSVFSATGTVDMNALDYLKIMVNGGADVNDAHYLTGYKIDTIFWSNESRARNYPCYRVDQTDVEGQHYDIDSTPVTARFLNYPGYALSTSYETLVSSTITTSSVDFPIDISGSLDPSIEHTFVFNTPAAVSGVTITNVITGKAVTLYKSLSDTILPFDVDTLKLGGLIDPTPILNTTPLDFSGVIPSFSTEKNILRVSVIKPTSQSQETFTTNGGLLRTSASSTYRLAQSFTAHLTGIMTYIELLLKVPFNSAGYTIEVRSDSAGSPGTVLTSFSMMNGGNGNVLNLEKIDFRANLGSVVHVTNGQVYWVVIKTVSNDITPVQLNWGYYATTDYAFGVAKESTNSGSTWSAALTGDQNFRVTINPTDAHSITYTAKYKKIYL